MKSIVVKENEAGQRFDKFLHKYLAEATGNFIYKMLRKKNITLNGKKATGSEKLIIGDEIKLFLSDETIDKFTKKAIVKDKSSVQKKNSYEIAYQTYGELEVIFQNKHILIVNKPNGILTQKSKPDDISLNEWLIGYLLAHHMITYEELTTFKPSVCNRLDRNTSGIVICGKTLLGSQKMSQMLKDRSLHKFYRLYVKGTVHDSSTIDGYLEKDKQTNTVKVLAEPILNDSPDSSYIKTKYQPLKHQHDKTLVEVELITGKTHQIRAHLASIGHPLLGDYKYGDKNFNDRYKKKYHINHQLLHAHRIEFPELKGDFEDISNRVITSRLPKVFELLEEGGR